MIRLRSGEMLTAYTHNYLADLERMIREGSATEVRWSSDGGQTWSEPVRPFPGVPRTKEATLVPLADGRVLLTHGVRHYPMGAQALLSADEGKTWDLDHRLMLAWHGAPYCGSLPDWGHAYPNGHPYSAQREDGKILTLYYRTADPSNPHSTVVEGVIWEVPA